MPTKIQLMRGNKVNLPILSQGEAAFTLDSKELFIGDGTANYNMTPTTANLLVNGNLQIATSQDSTETITITAGSGQYIYGCYYLSNDASAAGSITVSRNSNPSLPITITSTGGRPTLEYRTKLARTPTSTGFSYLQPNQNQDVTLSINIQNSLTLPLTYRWGLASSLGTQIAAVGINRYATTFTMSYPVYNTYNSMQVILFRTDSDFTGSVSLGDFKLELGKGATPFVPNPLSADACSISQTFQASGLGARCTKVTSDQLEFSINNPIPYPYNYGPRNINVTNVVITDLLGNVATGFSLSSATIDESSNLILIEFVKTSHLLTDASGSMLITVDARP